MLQLIDKKNRLFLLFFIFVLLSSINNRSFLEKNHSMLTIDTILVNGLSDKKNFEITNELKKNVLKNIFLLKNSDFTKVFEKNNLVQSFEVKKKYPKSILINIKKADLFAVTSFNNQKYFIGSNGKLIEYEKVHNYNSQLPFVFGKPNYSDFVILKKIIDKSEFDYKSIKSLYYFLNNRWDIKTNSGVIIKLPETDFLNTLNIANKIINDSFFKNNKIVDLRISNHIITTNE
jgi:cell division septal protein FtsQ